MNTKDRHELTALIWHIEGFSESGMPISMKFWIKRIQAIADRDALQANAKTYYFIDNLKKLSKNVISSFQENTIKYNYELAFNI